MKSIKDNQNTLLSAVLEIVIGVLLLINPQGFTSAIIILLGVMLIAAGLMSIVRYFMLKPEEAARNQGLSKGLVLLIVGGVCALFSGRFADMFPLLTMLYGILLLIMSAAKVQIFVDMVRLKKPNRLFSAISAALSVLLAVIVLLYPFETTAVVWMIIAIVLIAQAVLDVLSVFFKKRIG